MPPHRLQHRLATRADLPLLAAWNAHLIADEGHPNPMTQRELHQRMARWLRKGEYTASIFSSADIDFAYALYRESATELHLRQFFVTREHRRQGLGRACLTHLRSHVWPANKRLTVTALCTNAPAVAFWRACGYNDYALSFEIIPPQP